jgi:putative FmdB family regulatory protein
MPTYEYECTHCGHRFEASQKMTDPALTKCPKCTHKLKRLIGSGSGIIFKGNGFYATDYRKGSPSDSHACPKSKDGGCHGCPSQQ